jgi:hypothetical protein
MRRNSVAWAEFAAYPMGEPFNFINTLYCELGNKPPIPAYPASFANLRVLCGKE